MNISNREKRKNIDKFIGENLKVNRLAKNLSQTKLADKLGITFQQVQKYENGTNRISASTLYAISKILDVSLLSFFQGLDNKKLKDKSYITKENIELLRLYEHLPSQMKKSIKNIMKEIKN